MSNKRQFYKQNHFFGLAKVALSPNSRTKYIDININVLTIKTDNWFAIHAQAVRTGSQIADTAYLKPNITYRKSMK